ncbi:MULTISPECIES: ATP-binding protein [unclassified Streptomyces]|uniref:ATP-binding protein n=1 Tax=unclassified Streptomyces TaxID=2593676 RepID=UPI0029AD1E79|nr:MULTISPECIES: ATP-binding protein [unclassified Streptomyces]MDX3771655.1 ATP-binding protein [Streptomyces sp. AK08-01B]MDX3821292.1 ATP-binding protein [Streptomyces sp. AK08-01A]
MTTPPETNPNYHYLGLAGARPILTNASEETYANLVTTLGADNGNGAIMCIHGGVGLGKTFAVNLHLDELAPHTTLRIKVSSAKIQALRASLYNKLGLPGEAPANSTRCETMIKSALSEGPRVLVVDEAQWLDTRTFEFIRELWDDEETRLSVILVGAETTYQKIKNRPALDSRILIWQRYKPLTPTEVLTTIPQYHPVWTHTPPDDLLWIDDLACHGNFRQWAKITYLLQEAMNTPPHPEYSRDLVAAVFSRLDPTTRQ